MPALGDYVYVYWSVGTSYGLAGTVTGEEYTANIADLIAAGYGTQVSRPDGWTSNRTPADPNSAISRDAADERYGRIVVSADQPANPISGDAPILWVKDFGGGDYAVAVVTGD